METKLSRAVQRLSEVAAQPSMPAAEYFGSTVVMQAEVWRRRVVLASSDLLFGGETRGTLG
jgi:hypothetical protein